MPKTNTPASGLLKENDLEGKVPSGFGMKDRSMNEKARGHTKPGGAEKHGRPIDGMGRVLY